jgi:outer membrane protein assembly factor BamB
MVGSPVYDAQAGLIFVTTWSGHVYAMDARTGRVRWRFALPQAGSPGVGLAAGVALAGNTLFLGDDAGQVTALDAGTGRTRWIGQVPGAIPAAPVVRLGKNGVSDVYIADQNGNLTALNGASGTREWRIFLGELRSAPVLAGNELLIGSVADHGLFALS